MSLDDVKKDFKKIVLHDEIWCPVCGVKQYAPFDKLYAKAHDKCVMCTKDGDELQINADSIFAIVEEL